MLKCLEFSKFTLPQKRKNVVLKWLKSSNSSMIKSIRVIQVDYHINDLSKVFTHISYDLLVHGKSSIPGKTISPLGNTIMNFYCALVHRDAATSRPA